MGSIFNRKELNKRRQQLREEMTKAELLLWQQLKNKQMLGYKFRRQHSIGAYVVDFYCPKIKLAVEIDGMTHITNEEIEYDRQRQEEIETLGIQFLRFTNEMIFNDLNNVLNEIKGKIEVIENLEMT